jgi:hypothetical protein
MMEKKTRKMAKQMRKTSLDQMMKEEGFDQNETKSMRGIRIK